jgi:hypothetical protein
MDEQNLLDIQKKAKAIFKLNIINNIIAFLKKNNNSPKYEEWLINFNLHEYNLEFASISGKRTNKYYHDIWDELTQYNDFTIIY